MLPKNKWITLPEINLHREYPGAIILPSKRAYVFFGTDTNYRPINTIESLQFGYSEKWMEINAMKDDNHMFRDLTMT